METRALQLIERIYEASVEPSAWTTFVEELSETFGGAAIALSAFVIFWMWSRTGWILGVLMIGVP